MANYTEQGRTNYFRVKDLDAFKAELRTYGIEPASWEEANDYGSELVLDAGVNNKPEGAIALFSYGMWPSFDEYATASRLGVDIDDEADESGIPCDYDSLLMLVAGHLVDGEVAVFMEVGFEKMRYLAGTAVAVNAIGDTRRIDLDEIYDLAKELATKGTVITRAEY